MAKRNKEVAEVFGLTIKEIKKMQRDQKKDAENWLKLRAKKNGN